MVALYVRGFTQLPQKRKAATYFEGPGGHGQPLLDGLYVTQRVLLAYSKPGTSTGHLQCGGRYRGQIVMDLDSVTFTATACKLLFISICLGGTFDFTRIIEPPEVF